MAPQAKLSVPTIGNLPHAHRLPVTHREVVRTFSKLSRQSLLSLAQQWLSRKTRDFCRPYLYADQDPDLGDDDAQFDPAHSYEELQEIYKELGLRKGGRKEVVDRMLEGDWRNGISMYQLATAEIQYLLDHPGALRWNAKRLAKIQHSKTRVKDMEVTNDSEHLPRFQAQTFMANLARELSPLMKGHYLIIRIKTMPLTLLRVYIHDSPYGTESSVATTDTHAPDGAKSVFFVWPDGSPFVYVSVATHMGQVVGEEARHLRDIVLHAIPKAFSRPSSRYELQNTNFTARTLQALLTFRGPGKSNAAAGGWSIFADNSFSQNALDFLTAPRPVETGNGASKEEPSSENKAGKGHPKRILVQGETPEVKRRKEIAEGRFGTSAKENDGQGIERFEVRIDDPFPAIFNNGVRQEDAALAQPSKRGRKGRPSLLDRSLEEIAESQRDDTWAPDVRVTFQGSHVFAGIRQLVEQGVIDGEKMPGWMTGEAAVTVGAVKHGRIRTKGSVPGV
ncbi:CHL4-domain-containing protein [Zopfia rhizophila CBS 207.26]|uniref:CHL4-domain-containing protein n=1 Tax=Zopfia rhizophila CBS 207.26 TaxID=1314779 RepID=A0A6A6DZ38_9PEZI|nr:CHL4-domain-containing protein [Zopfia rhizophila CBS 207.26]